MTSFGTSDGLANSPKHAQTVLERLIAAGINETSARQHLTDGLVHVDGVQVMDADAPAERPAVVVLREPLS
jgi:hypothetical protein